MAQTLGGLRSHKLTPRQGEKILAVQGARCAICGSVDSPLEVDHDHGSCHPGENGCPMCVRGLLCGPCNTNLGHFEAGRIGPAIAQMAESMTSYLQSPPAATALEGYRRYVDTLKP